MKKSSLRFSLLCLLTVLSVSSYVYLSTRLTENPEIGMLNQEAVLMQEEEAKGYIFPDIETIKKVIYAVRRYLPAS
jgi:hypothetical protein